MKTEDEIRGRLEQLNQRRHIKLKELQEITSATEALEWALAANQPNSRDIPIK
jgi:hypothetical protein